MAVAYGARDNDPLQRPLATMYLCPTRSLSGPGSQSISKRFLPLTSLFVSPALIDSITRRSDLSLKPSATSIHYTILVPWTQCSRTHISTLTPGSHATFTLLVYSTSRIYTERSDLNTVISYIIP